MKRILISLAVASGLGLASSAAMADFVFDNYSENHDPVSYADSSIDATEVSSAFLNLTQGLSTSIAGLNRQIFVSKTGEPGAVGSNSIQVANGRLSYSSGDVIQGYGGARYTVDTPSVDLSDWSSLSLLFKVVTADLNGGVVTITFKDLENDTLQAIFNIPAIPQGGDPVDYVKKFSDFTNSGSFEWSKFASATVLIDGQTVSALDMSIDIIESVPEPGTLALLGLGLAGLGFAGRRRQK